MKEKGYRVHEDGFDTKSVPYEMFKTEMDAKNQAYVFILSNNLLDKFRVFCRNYKSSNPHQDAFNYLYYNLNQ